ncbi:MAG: hypothetical protein RIA63_10285, partial [Cyclobacteriaceae bacterium]
TFRTELLVGSTVVLSAILIVWSQWMMNTKSTDSLEAEIQSLRNQALKTERLQQEIDQLKAITPDTVTVIEYQERPSTLYLSLLRKIDRLETSLKTILEENSRQNELLLARLKDNEQTPGTNSDNYSTNYLPLANRVKPRLSNRESERAAANEFPAIPEQDQKNLSTKTIKDIQKHYQKGVGLRVGPTLTLGRGSYDVGDGRYDFGLGVLADLITSPSLSIEAGIIHTQRHNRIADSDILQPNDFPGVDPSLGELKNVDIDSWILEVPVNLKYRFPVSLKSNWFGGLGYTNMIYTKQVLEYDYRFQANPSASINSAVIDKNIKVYPGTLNLSLGFSRELKKKGILEASVYYRYGLGKVGIEQTTPDFIGIRGAYWFT